MKDTNLEFDEVIKKCKDIFLKKTKDYGTSWSVLRTISILDQIYIKAYRIRSIQEMKTSKVDEGIEPEFMGIINYGLIGLIHLSYKPDYQKDIELDTLEKWYDEKIKFCKEVMQNKNHDYGEAWRNMEIESLDDLILTKIMRSKQILKNDGKTLISEGIDANFVDIINYAIFALIKLTVN